MGQIYLVIYKFSTDADSGTFVNFYTNSLKDIFETCIRFKDVQVFIFPQMLEMEVHMESKLIAKKRK
jgi:hypothetical protein